MLSELRRDYERHGSSLRNPPFWLIASYRFGRWAMDLPGPARKLGSLVYGVMLTGNEFMLGSTLHRETEIGPGLHIVHADGIRIDPEAKIGARVGIMQCVTIGSSPDRHGAPVIGDDVFIGAGARILGPIKIGARSRIAANSLVVSDVPADATAVGVPAKVLRYTGRASIPPPAPPVEPAEREGSDNKEG
jgi:serine O-acetyltransferase